MIDGVKCDGKDGGVIILAASGSKHSVLLWAHPRSLLTLGL